MRWRRDDRHSAGGYPCCAVKEREAQARYNNSDRGRERLRRYEKSEAGRQRKARYQATDSARSSKALYELTRVKFT